MSGDLASLARPVRCVFYLPLLMVMSVTVAGVITQVLLRLLAEYILINSGLYDMFIRILRWLEVAIWHRS